MARWTSSRIAAACLMAAAPAALAAGLWQAGHLRVPPFVDDRPAEHTGTVLDGRMPDDDPARLDEAPRGAEPRQQAALPPAPADGAGEDPADVMPPAGPLADRLSPLAPTPEVAILRTVIDFYRKGDVAGGDAAARALPDGETRVLAEWLALRLAPRQAGFERITAFVKDNPGFPTQAQLRRRAEEALLAEQRSPRAVKAFFAGQPPQTVLGRLALARILAAEGKAREAGEMIRETWRRDDFNADLEARILAAFPRLLTPLDHRLRAERFLAREDWSDAARVAQRAGDDVAKVTRARVAAERAQGDAEKLVDALPKPLQADPSAILARVQVLRRKDKGVEAAKLLAGVPKDTAALVAPEAWWEERRALSRRLLDQNEPAVAYEVVAGAQAATGATRIDAEFHAGWIALRYLDRPAAASVHFAAAAAEATTPISISRAAYWRGRAAEAAGEPAGPQYERAAAHSATYYGQLARARLDLRDMPVRRADREPSPDDAGLAAVRLLYAAGARDLAAPLLMDLALRGDDAGAIAAAADLAAAAGDVRGVLAAGKAAVQRGLPLDNHAFPVGGVPAADLPVDGVEMPLVLAIARQESAFDPAAISPAGARGLMQLMPATARMTANRAGIDFALERLTSDPAYNATLGATHLTDLVGEWRGSYILTIAAYNAGSGNVKKWIEAYGDPRNATVDAIDWVERIPFYETRNYVQRVMENLQIYRSRLGKDGGLLIDADLQRGSAPKRDAAR
jgi:soluble lytic murein transglycosylase